MNIHCECPMSGYCKRHQMMKGPEQHKRCKGISGTSDCGLSYWKAWEEGRAGATAPPNPVLEPENFCSKQVTKSQIGTKLAEIIKEKTGKEIECQQCLDAIISLNNMTPDEANDVKENIVQDIVSRAFKFANWFEYILISADSVLNSGILHSMISAWFDEAVVRGATPVFEEVKKKLKKPVVRVAGGKLQHTREQQIMCELALNEPKPQNDPWNNGPIFHLGAHLWPTVIGDVKPWLWHIDRWNELAESINGKAFVCVAIGGGTVSASEVRGLLSDKIEMIELVNNPDGENQSFRKLQELIPQGQDDVLLYCHGKGVRGHTYNSDSVKVWSEIMYETAIFNFDSIANKLAEGYKTLGSFRTFGHVPLNVRNKWHYSGTFYSVRAKYLNHPVKDGYGGVEIWPGEHFTAGQCWNEFADNRPLKAQYDFRFMYPRTIDDQMQWEVDRLGGPRCEQHKRELDWFLNYVKPDDKILVIGSKHGGLEHQIRKSKKDVSILSCDIAPQPDNIEKMIIGDSSNSEIQQLIRDNGPYDVIFIDGDHSYNGVYKDWILAKSLNPRIVAFHDVAVAIKHQNEGCEVDKLWAEIKNSHTTFEKIVGCGWGGIGIVIL